MVAVDMLEGFMPAVADTAMDLSFNQPLSYPPD
jgi:hypothetical protein